MVIELFGERQGFANKSAYALPKRAVEALDVLRAFAMTMMPTTENDGLIRPQKVGIALGVQVASGQAVP